MARCDLQSRYSMFPERLSTRSRIPLRAILMGGGEESSLLSAQQCLSSAARPSRWRSNIPTISNGRRKRLPGFRIICPLSSRSRSSTARCPAFRKRRLRSSRWRALPHCGRPASSPASLRRRSSIFTRRSAARGSPKPASPSHLAQTATALKLVLKRVLWRSRNRRIRIISWSCRYDSGLGHNVSQVMLRSQLGTSVVICLGQGVARSLETATVQDATRAYIPYQVLAALGRSASAPCVDMR
mmetsp:Transcript_604/g.1223  ORF Transcript_604/g.1223 Transcript_604/m.1223 type:complete len:242 (-) Transcript_604:97-822(-)